MAEYDCIIKQEHYRDDDTLEMKKETEDKLEVDARRAEIGLPTDQKKNKRKRNPYSKLTIEEMKLKRQEYYRNRKEKLSAEDLERIKRRRQEYARLKREGVTPEYKKEYKKGYSHNRQKVLTAEEQAERKRRKREYDQKRRQSQSYHTKMVARKRSKRQNETPEEKQKRLEHNRMMSKASLSRMAELFPEKWEARLERRRVLERERKKKIKSAMTTPGELAEVAKMVLEEEKAKKRFRRIEKLATMTDDELREYKMTKFLRHHAWVSNTKGPYKNWSEEEKEKSRRQQRERARNLTGEKRRHWMESVNRARKKWLAKMKEENNEKWKKYQERVKEYCKKRTKEETPEERLRRHHKYKVNTTARKLRQQLAGEQVSVEEIERKVAELKTTMWKEFDPDYDKRPPKPRGRKRKITPPSEKKQLLESESVSSTPFKCLATDKEEYNMNVNFVETENLNVNSFTDIHADLFDISDSKLDKEVEDVNCEADFSHCASPVASPILSSSPPPEPSSSSSHSTSADAVVESTTRNSQCLYCPKVLCGDNLLRAHVCTMHPDKCWKCPICKEVVLSPLELSHHYNSSHKVVQVQIKNVKPLLENPFICMRCPARSESPHVKSFITKMDLFGHVKTQHVQHYWPCHFCNLLKYSQRSLKLHQNLCRKFRSSCQKS